MNHSETRIQEELPQEVRSLAAQLYAQKIQSSSPQDRMQATAETGIPPEFVQQAIAQIEAGQIQDRQPEQPYPTKHRQRSLLTLAAVLTVGALLSGAAMFLIARMLEPKVPVVTTTEPPVATFKRCQTNQPGKNLGGTNFQGADLRGITLCNANLGGANLGNTNLSGVDLSGANLSGANLANANLSGADLSGADLRGANLGNANLSRANLDGTVLTGANLGGATMPDGTVSR